MPLLRTMTSSTVRNGRSDVRLIYSIARGTERGGKSARIRMSLTTVYHTAGQIANQRCRVEILIEWRQYVAFISVDLLYLDLYGTRMTY